MKSLILMIAMFSIMLTAITILKYESSKLDFKIKTANDLKNKLQYDLSFLNLNGNIYLLQKTYKNYLIFI